MAEHVPHHKHHDAEDGKDRHGDDAWQQMGVTEMFRVRFTSVKFPLSSDSTRNFVGFVDRDKRADHVIRETNPPQMRIRG